jgi:ribonuclease HII
MKPKPLANQYCGIGLSILPQPRSDVFDLSWERQFGWPNSAVAGVDEAGRGAWCGPVVAAAVIMPEDETILGLNDSKKLSPRRRAALAAQIQHACQVGIGQASVEEIDRLNILQASLLAMRRALLAVGAEAALIDGNKIPDMRDVAMPCKPVIGGDAKIVSIAAASIIAKQHRDQIMDRLSEVFPDYDWQRNKGYGTASHQKALAAFGPCAHHRYSFKPIRSLALNPVDKTGEM